MKKYLYSIVLMLAAIGPVQAAELASIKVEEKGEIVTLTVPETVPHKVFTVANPDRLVVDVPSLPGRHSVALPSNYDGTLIKTMRFGQFDPETSRFVFDLNRPVGIADVREVPLKKQTQLIITIIAASEKAAKEQVVARPAEETKKPKAEVKPAPAKKAKKKEKPMVVIDPGHGGVDPGTIGPDGTQEKDVVFEYAKSLKSKLLKTGRYRVMLTRDDDRFIMLRKRVEIARKAGGIIFISLHADSAVELSARGLSVYTVSETASDQEAEALAARENKSDVLAGMDLSEERQDVADILISLAQRETKNRSATLADLLVTRLDDQVKLLPNAHRFAGFAVLKAPDVPSVLIEIGFLSHPKEEKLLESKAYREKVISGIASGVDAYFALQRKSGNE
jgi:N-acetylmuramoyl-L-alanine amidase